MTRQTLSNYHKSEAQSTLESVAVPGAEAVPQLCQTLSQTWSPCDHLLTKLSTEGTQPVSNEPVVLWF